MRTRKKTFVKCISATPNKEVTRHETKISTEARIKKLVNELGFDPNEYKFKANLRKFNRAFVLGINL